MSLLTDISDLVVRVAQEFNTVKGSIGDTGNLTTNDTTNLVNSINELKGRLDLINTESIINDYISVSSTKTWSINKLRSYIQTQRNELSDLISNNTGRIDDLDESIEDLEYSISGLVSFRDQQNLNYTQKLTARNNIDAVSIQEFDDLEVILNNLILQIGPDVDYVSIFNNDLEY